MHSLILQKTPSGPGCVGLSNILDQDKVVLESGSCLGKENLLQHTSVHLLIHGAIHHNHLTFAAIVKSNPYDGRWADITICSPHMDINVPLPLPPTHPSSPIFVMHLDPWLISEGAVSPVSDVPTQWRLAYWHWRLFWWCTKVSLGHRADMREW